MTLETHVCFGVNNQDQIQRHISDWTQAVMKYIHEAEDEVVRQLILESLDITLAKENPTWSDYRFLAEIKRKIDDVLG